MPYVFLWGNFTLKDQPFETEITHLTDSAIENFFMTRKQLIPSPCCVAYYVKDVAIATKDQCNIKRKACEMLSSEEEASDEDENAEQDACLAVDKWNHKRAKLLKVSLTKIWYY